MSNKIKLLDLFSGIGGWSLGLERTGGFETVAFCEQDKYATKVLNKHWPEIKVYEDVKTLTARRLAEDGIGGINAISAGWPCQDFSVAGKQAGITGERSGLWSEIVRLVSELGPRFLFLENVTALISGGNGEWFGKVLGDLAALGYDAEWHCIPASALGASHRRDRIWIVAYPNREGFQERLLQPGVQGETRCNDDGEDSPLGGWRFAKPEVVRRLHGIPNRVDRLRCLGNSLVPQIPEMIGRCVLKELATRTGIDIVAGMAVGHGEEI